MLPLCVFHTSKVSIMLSRSHYHSQDTTKMSVVTNNFLHCSGENSQTVRQKKKLEV